MFDRCLCGQHDAYVVVVTFDRRRTKAELNEAATLVVRQVPGISDTVIDEGESEILFNLHVLLNNEQDAVIVAENVRVALALGDIELERRTEGEPLTYSEKLFLMMLYGLGGPGRRRGPSGEYWRGHRPPWADS